MLRLTNSLSYIPYDNPHEMLEGVDVVFVGTVQHISTAVVADELDGQGALLVGLRPTEVWKGKPAMKDGLVYLSLHRPKNVGVGTYRKSLPLETEFVVFGLDHPPSTKFASGDPGVTVYVPEAQGLFVGERSGLTNVWGTDVASSAWADTVAGLRTAAVR